MRRSFVAFGLFVSCLLGCGVPNEVHQETVRKLEDTSERLDAAKKRISELETEIHKLRETDEAYWAEILALEKERQWSEVQGKATELLSRWPNSAHSDDARRASKRATEAMAQELYDQAQKDIQGKHFASAKRILSKVRDEYPDTAAHSRAVVLLRDVDRLIEEARRSALGNGRWRVSSQVSPIDDSTNVYLSLSADDNTIWGQPPSGPIPSLWIRCKENHTEVFVSWEVYLGIDTTDVLQRLDDERARTRAWSISTDHEATFYPGSDIGFVRELMSHKKLLLQVTPYGESPVRATFSLAGLENALVELRKSCGW